MTRHQILIRQAKKTTYMTDNDPERNNPLSPYYPSQVPTLRGNGRKWFVALILVLWLSTTVWSVISSLI